MLKTLRLNGHKTQVLVLSRATQGYIFDQLERAKRAKDSERFGEELENRRRNVRQHLKDNSDRIDPVEKQSNENYVLPRPLRKGDNVLIININKKAVVTSLPDKRNNVGVRAGLIDTRTSLNNLRLLEDEEITITDKDKKKVSQSTYHASKIRDFSPEIDLRGKNGDEAWFLVDKYFDDAQVSGINTVRLIHGKGTGALKAALWRFLKTDGRVASFRIGQFGEGDGGVTVVELK